MKKTLTILTIALISVLLIGCGGKTLVYIGNLGYQFSGHDQIIFNVYHSNTKDHCWENIATFPCSPKNSRSCDIDVEGAKDTLTINVTENEMVEKDDTVSFLHDSIASYEYTVEGFDGFVSGFRTFEIKDIEDEQFYRLYPISNDSGIYYYDLALDHPYDPEGDNLDNLLITITLR